MQKFFRILSLSLVLSTLNAGIPDYLQYDIALVRDLSSSFEDSLKLNPPPIPINLEQAHQQHENYINVLKQLLPKVVRLDGDSTHPDCNFIEDTAIIIKDIAVISRMGAFERRGEEIPVKETLKELGLKTVSLKSPGTMDGGDILYTGRHLFVGISKRTNLDALNQLKEIFNGKLEVIGIPVLEGLHLKSVVSLFDDHTLILAETIAGTKVRDEVLKLENGNYTCVYVPDSVASNVVRIGPNLIVQEGFPNSEMVLADLCSRKHVNMIKLNMSELIKADGALTCGSLLVSTMEEKSQHQMNIADKYVDFCNKIGKGQDFDPFAEGLSLFTPDLKKDFNGKVVEGREQFIHDLLSVYKTYGSWTSTPVEVIHSENSVVIRTIIEAMAIPPHTAIVILHFNENTLINQIIEVCAPNQNTYNFTE